MQGLQPKPNVITFTATTGPPAQRDHRHGNGPGLQPNLIAYSLLFLAVGVRVSLVISACRKCRRPESLAALRWVQRIGSSPLQ